MALCVYFWIFLTKLKFCSFESKRDGLMVQIEAGLVQKQYVAKVVGVFPEGEQVVDANVDYNAREGRSTAEFYGSAGKETEMIDEPFFDDLVEENDEDDETEGSVDFLMRFLQSMFRKVLKRAKKASRSTLLAAISTQLVSFVVDKVLLLATLSIVKTLLKLFCTLGDRKWRIENK